MLFFSYLRFMRPSATFIYSSDVGRGFSLAAPPKYVHGDSNPEGLPYRIEIPIRFKLGWVLKGKTPNNFSFLPTPKSPPERGLFCSPLGVRGGFIPLERRNILRLYN